MIIPKFKVSFPSSKKNPSCRTAFFPFFSKLVDMKAGQATNLDSGTLIYLSTESLEYGKIKIGKKLRVHFSQPVPEHPMTISSPY